MFAILKAVTDPYIGNRDAQIDYSFSDGELDYWTSHPTVRPMQLVGARTLIAFVLLAAGVVDSRISAGGRVVAWGDNSSDQTSVPPDLTDVVAIAGGGYHSLALRSDGTVVGWGEHSAGDPATPPAGLKNVRAIAATEYHSLALRADGTVFAWGDTYQGVTNIPPEAINVVAIAGGGRTCFGAER